MLTFQPISISIRGAIGFLVWTERFIHIEDFQQRCSYSTWAGYGQKGSYKASFQRDDLYDGMNAYAYGVDEYSKVYIPNEVPSTVLRA